MNNEWIDEWDGTGRVADLVAERVEYDGHKDVQHRECHRRWVERALRTWIVEQGQDVSYEGAREGRGKKGRRVVGAERARGWAGPGRGRAMRREA